jgi:hypothetical protein
MVTNQKTGVVLGYFVSAIEFEEYLKVQDLLPKALAGKEHTAGVSDRIRTGDRGTLALPERGDWYSWVDSNHRPPDPQSAVIARHDPTNPVTCPREHLLFLDFCHHVGNCQRHGPTRPDARSVLPLRYPNSVSLANHHFSLPICQVVEVPMARALSDISVRDPGCG